MKLFGKLQKKKRFFFAVKLLAVLFFLLLLNLFLYKIFSRRALSFGCFDDCANYMEGYFMLHGKTLYSQIYDNHIMGMAWASYFTQMLHHSINIYDLVLTHRKVIMAFAFILDFLIILRFKWKGFFFVIFYELSKFYFFGDRFLGESVAVYAAVYLLGLVWEKLNSKKLSKIDFLISGFFTWLIIFMREPYIPLALFFYAVILWGKFNKDKVYSVILFLALIIVVAINTDIPAFTFNDFTVNNLTIIKTETSSSQIFGIGILQVIFYPLFVFFYGKINSMRIFEVLLSGIFIFGIVLELRKKKWILVLFFLIALGLANIRFNPPGTVYFEAYHQMVWYGMFLFSVLLLIYSNVLRAPFGLKNTRIVGLVLMGILIAGWGILVFGPGSYLYDKIDLQEELLTNFGTVMNVGTVVKDLSNQGDTLFLDGADDVIYWQSGLFSPYPYSWYTGLMPEIPVYRAARLSMFKTNPPIFYYDFCSPDAPYLSSLPNSVRGKYQQLNSNGKPSCLYVLKSKLSSITPEQWQKAKEGFFELPRE